MNMEYKSILYKKDDGIAQMVINRPEKRNALNRSTRLEMMDALEDTKADSSIKVLIISGAGGKSFIAGSDLNELSAFSPLEMEDFMATIAQQFYTRFEQLDKPVIAMIDGLCLGGGLELAMACDIRIAAEEAKIGYHRAKGGGRPPKSSSPCFRTIPPSVSPANGPARTTLWSEPRSTSSHDSAKSSPGGSARASMVSNRRPPQM